MKIVIANLLLLLLTIAGFAQAPAAPAKGQMPQVPAIGAAFGKVVDSAGKPLNGASVLLLSTKFDTATKKYKEVLLSAKTTKANGEFRFESLPLVGQLTIKISNTGFEGIQRNE